MRLGQGVEWSVHCCTVLGSLPPDTPLSGARLAEFHDVPSAYLTKQLQSLTAAGIVDSIAGRRGGYRLARPAAQISLLDIVLAIEGPDPAFRCSEIRQRGPSAVAARHYVKPCGIARAMWRAEDAWRRELESVSIADLLEELGTTLHQQQADRAITWVVEVLS